MHQEFKSRFLSRRKQVGNILWSLDMHSFDDSPLSFFSNCKSKLMVCKFFMELIAMLGAINIDIWPITIVTPYDVYAKYDF